MLEIRRLSKLHQDYLVSFLRSQLNTLQNVLNSIESAGNYDEGYVWESLRRVEQGIKRFRRIYLN